ncbi:MAG: hypothetical protein R3E13_09545 [Alphaproteobacteria bacterium]
MHAEIERSIQSHPKIMQLFSNFSEGEIDRVFQFYGQHKFGTLAFDLEFGKDNLKPGQSYHYGPNFQSEEIFDQLTSLKTSSTNKIYCSASIPSPTRHDGGHAVALVIDNENKAILFHDPYGTPPSDEIKSVLENTFSGYTINVSSVAQQRDRHSCGLITAMNLAAYAKGEGPDPEIQDRLFDIRIKHAPAVLEHFTQEARASVVSLSDLVNSTSKPIEAPPEKQGKKKLRWVITNPEEDLDAARRRLAALEKLNANPDILGAEQCFCITLTQINHDMV